MFSKENFFRSKIFKKSFFFKIVELFIYLIFFHETEVWCQVLLKVLFCEKKNYQISNLNKKNIFYFFQRIYCWKNINLFFIFEQTFENKFSRWLFDFVERDLWYLWWHWDYLSCSPGLGEHFHEKKKLADCISSHLKKQSFLGVLSRFSSFFGFFPTIVDYVINKWWK